MAQTLFVFANSSDFCRARSRRRTCARRFTRFSPSVTFNARAGGVARRRWRIRSKQVI